MTIFSQAVNGNELKKQALPLHQQKMKDDRQKQESEENLRNVADAESDSRFAILYSLSLICIKEGRPKPIRKWLRWHCPYCIKPINRDNFDIHRTLHVSDTTEYAARAKAEYFKCSRCGYEFAYAACNNSYQEKYLRLE